MKTTIAAAATFVILATPASAGLFCDDNTWEFARWRTDASLSDVQVEAHEIISGREQGLALICDSATNTCRSVQPSPPIDPAEMVKKFTERVKKYEAKVTALEEWANALTWCAKRAYQDRVEAHKGWIKKDWDAIEFLKTPAPFEPNS